MKQWALTVCATVGVFRRQPGFYLTVRSKAEAALA
ncbi:hypothetical protein MPC4_200002 [Methylocella tundrae]|uniref:Uncharacterized protein n=1 Tax=Methylocella tundrae TaxID=227605 RepID=A0A8B6M726_METTU|nr:hypothetical protein MPC4_200002 [Methylocella tundrae]